LHCSRCFNTVSGTMTQLASCMHCHTISKERTLIAWCTFRIHFVTVTGHMFCEHQFYMHANELLGFDVNACLQAALENKACILIALFHTNSSKPVRTINHMLESHQGCMLPAVLPALMAYFRENADLLIGAEVNEHGQHFSGCFSSFGQPTLPWKIVFVGRNTFAPIMLQSLGLTVAVNVQQVIVTMMQHWWMTFVI